MSKKAQLTIIYCVNKTENINITQAPVSNMHCPSPNSEMSVEKEPGGILVCEYASSFLAWLFKLLLLLAVILSSFVSISQVIG